MKSFILVAAILIGTSSFASELKDKTLRVGTAADRGSFAACVASEAMAYGLADFTFVQLLHSALVKSDNPPMQAELDFLTESNYDGKKKIFRVVLESLDAVKGWQLIQHSNGEVAPFSTSVSAIARVYYSNGEEVGDFDLSACADK